MNQRSRPGRAGAAADVSFPCDSSGEEAARRGEQNGAPLSPTDQSPSMIAQGAPFAGGRQMHKERKSPCAGFLHKAVRMPACRRYYCDYQAQTRARVEQRRRGNHGPEQARTTRVGLLSRVPGESPSSFRKRKLSLSLSHRRSLNTGSRGDTAALPAARKTGTRRAAAAAATT
ncbi:hypothetical protein HPB51_019389 [Rhipicephalus microplus]|uniref:Uncharacterized protein n=1 Tax=Rhipicephalus microplus TaxID=6941 RepID=A0A9J6DBI7_RHIMP|nr:hypothetical protein HPB51_019389 [Rhipicephalus microplus]